MDELDQRVPLGAGASDEAAFMAGLERHRDELQAHCYRFLGSLEDAEDVVQETALRAWRRRSGFEGRSSFRAWLYRIATNACIDLLRRRPARIVAAETAEPAERGRPISIADLPWLDPYPGALLSNVLAEDGDPEAAAIDRETIELAFLVAIQQLAPVRRAVLILRDVLGWSAKETAAALDITVPAVNSALLRARAKVKPHLRPSRAEWSPPTPSAAERELLESYMAAHEAGDVDSLAALLQEDVTLVTTPLPSRHVGREAFLSSVRRGAAPSLYRYLPTSANGQLAAASYMRRPGSELFTPLAIDVLRVEGDRLAEVAVFLRPDLFAAFGLPPSLS